MSYKGYNMTRVTMGDRQKDDSLILIDGLRLVKPFQPVRSIYEAMKLIDEDLQAIAELNQGDDYYLI